MVAMLYKREAILAIVVLSSLSVLVRIATFLLPVYHHCSLDRFRIKRIEFCRLDNVLAVLAIVKTLLATSVAIRSQEVQLHAATA